MKEDQKILKGKYLLFFYLIFLIGFGCTRPSESNYVGYFSGKYTIPYEGGSDTGYADRGHDFIITESNSKEIIFDGGQSILYKDGNNLTGVLNKQGRGNSSLTGQCCTHGVIEVINGAWEKKNGVHIISGNYTSTYQNTQGEGVVNIFDLEGWFKITEVEE